MGIRSLLRKVFGRDRADQHDETPATSVPPQTAPEHATTPQEPRSVTLPSPTPGDDAAKRAADDLVAAAFDNPKVPQARTSKTLADVPTAGETRSRAATPAPVPEGEPAGTGSTGSTGDAEATAPAAAEAEAEAEQAPAEDVTAAADEAAEPEAPETETETPTPDAEAAVVGRTTSADEATEPEAAADDTDAVA
ncbi:hypothetical protein ABZY12_04495, partial [Streptomyces sp. NPDC006551]